MLWTDERICELVDNDARPQGSSKQWAVFHTYDVKGYMMTVRDDYQQRIEELEAENTKLRGIHTMRKRNRIAILNDANKLIEELRSENIRLRKTNADLNARIERHVYEYNRATGKLRALLPGPEVRAAIRELADDAAQMDDYYYEGIGPDIKSVEAWLDNIEAERETNDG